MKKFFKSLSMLITFLIGLSLISNNVSASLKINEIYPAPPAGEFEWVEIYNDGLETVNLSSYSLTDDTNKQIKFFLQNIDPLSYATATSSSVLNNDGDIVYLKNLEEIIEAVSYSEKFSSDKSFAKCPDGSGSWFILSGITKNASNDSACLTLSPTSSPTDSQSPILSSIPTSNPTPQTYNNIYLSEVMTDPKTESNEWVEIYNDNDYQATLNNWYVDDLENSGSTPKKFSLIIEAHAYGIFELSTSIFNNDGDSIRLMDFNQIEKDSFQYQSSEKGKTLGRINFTSDIFCLQNPSKGMTNNPCLNPTSTAKISPSPTIVLTKTPTPNFFPSLITKIGTIVKKPTGYFLISQNETEPANTVLEENDILGLTTENKKIIEPRVQAILFSLSFASFSYSILAIISILFKVRMSHKAYLYFEQT